MSGSVQLERKAFDKALRDFERETGLGAHDVVRDIFQSFLRGVVRAMKPKTTKQGREAILSDLHKVLGSIDSKPALERLHENFGTRFAPLQFEDNLYAASAHVERFRNKRGRIPRSVRPRAVRAGPYTFDGKMYTTKRNYNQILREKVRRIGLAKGGWNAAAIKFGLRLPGWISRHTSAPGGAYDTHTKGSAYFEVAAWNKVPHAQRHKDIVERGIMLSTRDLIHNMDRMLARIAKKHSAR